MPKTIALKDFEIKKGTFAGTTMTGVKVVMDYSYNEFVEKLRNSEVFSKWVYKVLVGRNVASAKQAAIKDYEREQKGELPKARGKKSSVSEEGLFD